MAGYPHKYFFGLVLFLTIGLSRTGLAQVVDTVPSRNATAASIDTDIVFTLSQAVDVSTIADTVVYAWGRWSGRALGTVTVQQNGTEIRFSPERSFFYGEMVTVRLPSTLRMTDGSMLSGGYTLQFWTGLLSTGAILSEVGRRSTRVSGETFIQSYGAYSGDLDSDGSVDLIVPNERTNDIRIFKNNGAGAFVDPTVVVSLIDGSAPSTNEGADFNRDGRMDFAVGNSTGNLVSVFTGDGTGGFSKQDTYATGLGVRGLCTGDFNGDGWEDIVTANRAVGKVYLLMNSGDGTFEDAVQLEPGGSGESGCAVADYSGDGIEDLFIGNLSSQTLTVMRGDGNGGFLTVNTIDVNGDPWMLAAGDLNGDGIPDIVSANSSGQNVSVTLMQEDGQSLSHIEYFSGSFQLAVDLGDFDGDGDLDVVTSNFSSRDFTFWENKGDGILDIYETFSTTGAGSCMILHDRDGDGDLDATGIDELSDELIFFENQVGVTGVEPRDDVFRIVELFPNPAHDEVTIRYRTRSTIHASVVVFDSIGREVARLMDGAIDSGERVHVWDISDLRSGVYFIRSNAAEVVAFRTLVIAK
ncbi:MAG: T9SS type A sorting domain-containing protein [Rhodothermales bacterium]|nr:T9SS type A sorting domain-containing protein [Rhodothermales bacterium]